MEDRTKMAAVPEQRDGRLINAETTKEMPDTAAATDLFQIAKARLLNVNGWKQLAGNALAEFRLTNHLGLDIAGPAEEGFYFKIDIPGPGTKAGEGFDWVTVENVETHISEGEESIAVTVRPAANPTSSDPSTAHFYSDESTSTFIVSRKNTIVTALVADRNIKPNPSAKALTDQIRNAIVGTAGMFSFSKVQWKSLTDGLLNTENL